MGVALREEDKEAGTIQGYRVNERIRAESVRLIGPDGAQMGIVSLEDALKQARESEMDLVEVAPQAEPPVCKLLDYGKFKYRQKKKKHGQKHHRAKVKEIRIGLTTDEHDLAFKAARVREFLQEHDKVIVSMRLRGRQRAHGDLALEHMAEFAGRFEDVARIERGPERSRAGQVSMLLIPK
jgi:translation initiation factor IF-3